MNKFDANQKKAATSRSQFILCDSKAGSGKTKTLMDRCLFLMDNGAKAEEIMMVTFTNKAAQEMNKRIRKISPDGSKVLCGTFHTIALMFLKKYSYLLEYESTFSVTTPDDAEKIIRDILKDYQKLYTLDETTLKVLKPSRILAEYSRSRNMNIPFEEYLESRQYTYGNIAIFIDIINAYESRKAFNDLMDFDDLLINFNYILNLPVVKNEITSRFKYVMVDEFQDVNDIQFSIVDSLLDKHTQLFVVGDPYQCIYGFRGSKIEHIANFEEYYGAEVISLNINYRSTQEILDLASQVTGNRAKMIANNGNGVKPKMFISKGNFGNIANEKIAQRVAENIKYLINIQKQDPEEIAILVRSVNQLQLVEAELKSRGIAYVLRAGFSYFEKVQIKDTLCFLSIFVNKKNKEALARVLNLFKGFGPKAIKTFIQEYDTIGQDMDCMNYNINNGLYKLGKSAKEGFDEFYKLYKNVESAETIENKLNIFFKQFYHEYLKKEYIDDADVRLSDTMGLIVLSKKHEKLEDFINEVMVDSSINNKETGDDKVKKIVVSTVHRAKGLEWDNVFICNLESLYKAPTKIDEEEEEDFEVSEDERLMYVAITRARKNLEIYATQNDFYGYGKSRVNLTHVIRKIRMNMNSL